jgi:predicted ester cyclase
MDALPTIRWYCRELWNQWRYELIPELLSPQIVLRGSLGVDVRGHEGFRCYIQMVQRAFPNFHNTIEQVIAQDERLAVHLTYRGIHSGPLFDHQATGKRVEYSGIALFRVADTVIREGWVLGDTVALWKQLSLPPLEWPVT